MGIYSIKKFGLTSSRGRDRVGVGIRSSYIRVLGIQVDTDGSGELAVGPWLCCALRRALSSLLWIIVRPPDFPVLTLSTGPQGPPQSGPLAAQNPLPLTGP